jgi:hypothetical protein
MATQQIVKTQTVAVGRKIYLFINLPSNGNRRTFLCGRRIKLYLHDTIYYIPKSSTQLGTLHWCLDGILEKARWMKGIRVK